MSLKNVQIIVDNIDESIDFYEELFGLRVITRQEGNVIMLEGLVLQGVDVWYDSTKIYTTPHNNMTELYFEDNDIEGIIEKMESGKYVVSYVKKLMEQMERQRRNADMNIQIFGTKKCNDTKKAERFFKERGIKYQFIDMKEKGMSKGEFNSVAQVNGGLENMINWDGKDKDLLALIKYTADEDKLEKVFENPQVIKTPVVRNGKQSTLGYQPDIWKGWN